MTPSKPPLTNTTHILPFDKLSPLDFERLCLWLVEREGYVRAEHLGLAGSEQGRDVIAYKPAPGGDELWYFQCKRYASIRAKTLKDEVDKYLALVEEKPKLCPVGVVFVVSCAVSARTRDAVGTYCEQHGLAYEFWALTELDMRVKQSPDLLAEFFGLQAFSSRPKVYHNLPQPDYVEFVGRKEELARLQEMLLPKSRAWVITIDGIGGIGKSALALEVAHRYLREYDQLPEEERFDAIIWASAKSLVLTADGIKARQQIMRTLDDIYITIAVTLDREDITRARAEEQNELVTKALVQQRTLLIVDNLETVDDERVNAFLRELPAPTKAIVTTRHRIDVAYPMRLTGIPKEDALDLIAQECAKKSVTLANAEAAKLYRRTGGVPLAIVWGVAQMGYGYGIDSVLQRLGQPTGDIAHFCFEGVMERIRGNPAHKLLMALALFVPDASRESLGYVTNLPELDRDDGLVDLERLSLVNKLTDRFALLPLTKVFALAELAGFPHFKANALRRRIDYLKDLCQTADSEYYWRYKSHAFYEEGDNILEAIEQSYAYGTADDVFLLTLAANDYLDTAGYWHKNMELCRRALGLARSIQKPIAIARFAILEGWMLKQWGEYKEAESSFSEALEHYRSINNREGESIALYHLSSVYRKRKTFQRAEELNNQARLIAEEFGLGDLRSLINVESGKLARDMGNWELAYDHFSQVGDWFQQRAEETPRDEMLARSIWGHLAIVELRLGRPQEAKALCLESLEYFTDRSTKGFFATLKYRLALAEEALNEYSSALVHAQEAMYWFDRLGMKPDLAEAQVLLERLEQVS